MYRTFWELTSCNQLCNNEKGEVLWFQVITKFVTKLGQNYTPKMFRINTQEILY